MSGSADMEEIRIADGDLQISLSRLGGAIHSASFRGRAFMVAAGGADGGAASFPLVPFGNRVGDNVMTVGGRDYCFRPNMADPLYLHGDGWLGLWDIVSHSRQKAEMTFRHAADHLSPYRYQASQRFSISGNCLVNTLSVTNSGDAPMPFGLGFHPYFLLTPQMTLTAPAQHFWTEREGHLPEKRGVVPELLGFSRPRTIPPQWVNNAFEGWDGRARIVWPELKLVADIEADPVFGNYMIYTPGGEADFFCFEPMTHLPNGHHMPEFGGLVVLQPGESLAGQMAISLSALEI